MKIVMATDSYPPDVNGDSVFSQNLARGLHARGHIPGGFGNQRAKTQIYGQDEFGCRQTPRL